MFKGSNVALITPFKDNNLDEENYIKLINFHLENNTNGLVPAGTTAEKPSNVVHGMLRFNTEDKRFEGYDGIEWGSLGSGTKIIDKDNDTRIVVEETMMFVVMAMLMMMWMLMLMMT